MTSSSEIVRRLRSLDTESVSDALDSVGITDGLVVGVRQLWPSRRIAGRVIPVRLVAHDQSGVVPARHLGSQAVDSSSEDDVIVVDNAARATVAGWGGLLSRAARVRRIAGVVVYGAVRDVGEAQELDFPVYGTAAVPRTARGRVVEEQTVRSLTLGATMVRQADYVIADASGVIVIPAEAVETVLTRAEEVFAREQSMARAIDSGVAVSEVMSGAYEHMLDTL